MGENVVTSSRLDTETICKYLLKNSLYNAVFILDTEGIIRGVSKGVEASYGYTEEDVYGQYFGLLFTDNCRLQQKPEIEIATVLQYGNASDYNDIVHKDGRHIWTEGESVLIKNAEGYTFIIKNVHSLERQKNLENYLKERNEKLFRINNDLDTFVHAASHDLKNPVNNIESLIEIVKSELRKGASAADMEPAISRITLAVQRFKNTLHDLSTIGSVDSSNDVPYLLFGTVLQEVMFDLNTPIETTNASIHVDFSGCLGIHFSKKNLRSIIYNLVSNALKYKSDDRSLEIDIQTRTENGYSILVVKDNGVGIDSTQHEKIFEFFKRAHTHVEGSGIGLGIVKKIMDNAEGKILLESNPDIGSVFTLYFNE